MGALPIKFLRFFKEEVVLLNTNIPMTHEIDTKIFI